MLHSTEAILAGRKILLVDDDMRNVFALSSVLEEEGLDVIFKEAGFEWRFAGCSMCLGMNDDQLKTGERCASSSNRNFEGRQGPGGRTHLMSPEMVAAAAIEGCIVDIRKFLKESVA